MPPRSARQLRRKATRQAHRGGLPAGREPERRRDCILGARGNKVKVGLAARIESALMSVDAPSRSGGRVIAAEASRPGAVAPERRLRVGNGTGGDPVRITPGLTSTRLLYCVRHVLALLDPAFVNSEWRAAHVTGREGTCDLSTCEA